MKLQRLAVEKVETGRSAILKEVQADFDRYLRNFVKDSDLLKKTKKSYQVNDDWEIRAFQSRWADFLINEPEDSDDLRPTLGLDRHDPDLKPYRLFNRYEVSSALNRSKRGYNLMFERELHRVRTNRDNLKNFL